MTLDGQTFLVEIELGLHADTGQVFATFQTIDPNTDLPPDVLTGFLPPEDGTGRGLGYFSYLIKPKPTLPTGAVIHNVALITFDGNPAIATDPNTDEVRTITLSYTFFRSLEDAAATGALAKAGAHVGGARKAN